MYLLSIVIPTKNRYGTLFDLVDALMAHLKKEPLVEIVIHDNSDDNTEAQEFFNLKKYDNLKYIYYKDWLSVGGNSDRAILESSGKYVTFIGDDDAVASTIVAVAKIMDKYDIDSCACDYSLYRWPAALMDNYSFEYKKRGGILRQPDVNRLLENILHNGIQNKDNMPGVYHGIVKRSVLDKVYEKTGTFFPGPSPDMANSFALSQFVTNHVVTSIPFIVDGYSKASTGHMTEAKQHIGKLEDQKFLPKDTIEKWHEFIPKIWLPNTIWPESGLQSLERCGNKQLTKKFNANAMYIKISVFYPQCKKMCHKYVGKYSNWISYLLTYFTVGYSYVNNKINNKKNSSNQESCREKKMLTIGEAIDRTDSIIEKDNMLSLFEKELINGQKNA